MAKTARHRVLEFFRLHHGASAAQVARGLGMSTAAVRHHLRILQGYGRVEVAPSTYPRSRGRPEKRYRLSQREVGDNLANLANDLLTQWSATEEVPSSRRRLVESLALGLEGQLGSFDPRHAVAAQISALVSRLNQLHYEAHWEAGAEGPRILFAHCPYAAIIDRHPELCEMDSRALGDRLGVAATQTAKMDLAGRGPTQCIFSLGSPAEKAAVRGR